MGRRNRVWRAAVIGYGVSGSVFHAPLIGAHPEFELAAIVTGNPERAASAQGNHPDAQIMGGFPALLSALGDGLTLDVAVLGTPPGSHMAQAEELMRRGIGVVVDKPFTPTVAEAEHLQKVSRETGSLLTVFQNRRWDGDFLTLRSLLADGALGTIQTFESRFEWFSRNTGGWKDNTPIADGGGILLDVGSHLVDQAIELFGPLCEATAELVRYAADDGPDEDAFVSLLHVNGVRSRLWMNSKTPAEGPRFHVVGSRAAFTTRVKDPQEAQLAAGMVPADPGYGYHAVDIATVSAPDAVGAVALQPGRYQDFYTNLADALSGHEPAPVDPAESTRVLEILENLHSRYPVRRPSLIRARP